MDRDLGESDARLQRLVEVGRTLLSELDLDAVLQRLLEVARELTGARYAAVGVLDDRRERLERFLTAGLDAETRQAIGDLAARPRRARRAHRAPGAAAPRRTSTPTPARTASRSGTRR